MEEIQLKDICDLDNGYAFKSDDYVDNSNTLNCRMSNIRPDGSFDILYSAKYLPDEFAEKYKDYILHDGDLIIAMTDMAGDPKILGVPTVVDTQGFCLLLNQRVGRLRFIRDGVNADYLKLALQCPKVRTYLKRFAGGGVQLNVSKKDILSAPVCMRNEEEQNHIAGLFKRVLEVKTKRERELQLLDDLIKARFVEMFGDPLINSFGLETKPMTEVCEIIDGDRGKNYPTADEFTDEGYCLFLNAKNVTASGFNFDTCMFVSKEKDGVLRKGKLSRGDVVLTTRGTLGNLAFYTNDIPFEHVRINSGMVILRMKQELVNEVYFIEQFKMQLADIKEKIASGSAQPQLPISTMNKIQILIPDIEIQKQFADFVHQVDKSKVVVQKALDETQLLFDSLMQKYFG